jgi:uroporphyrinogen-III synthase
MSAGCGGRVKNEPGESRLSEIRGRRGAGSDVSSLGEKSVHAVAPLPGAVVSADDFSKPVASGETPLDSSGPHPQLKAVVVTRAESANGPLSSQLRDLGLQVLLWPAVSVAVAETGPLEEALRTLSDFHWIVFASRYAVAAVTERVAKAPAGLRVAAVGQATAQVLRQRGWPVDLVPDDASAAALVSAFATLAIQDRKILFPASSRALPTIAAGLTQLGAHVAQVEAYRTEPASLDVEECRAWIERDAIGAVTFASPSAVIELERALGKEYFGRLLSGAKGVAIGATTARELEERGRTPVVAETATLRGLASTTHKILQARH